MKKLLALVAAGTVLAGCGLVLPGLNTTDGPLRFGARHKLPKGAKKWTILMHVAADNNLCPFAVKNMNEMEAGLDPADVNVICLYDGDQVGDSGVYEIQKDPNGMNDTLVSKINTDLPFIPSNHEINSGDPAVLKAFGEWAIQHYPAEHYGLGIWDHGSGIFRKKNRQTHPIFPAGMVYKGFSWDDNDGGHMETADLTGITTDLAKAAGQPLDFLGFDACLMGHVEISYQVKDAVNYVCASEQLEPGPGWDYQGWLSQVNGNSTPAQVASALVDSYVASYQPGHIHNPDSSSQEATMGASDVHALTASLVPALNNAADVFTKALSNASDKAALNQARQSAQTFYNNDCADLGDFCKNVLASKASSGVTRSLRRSSQSAPS